MEPNNTLLAITTYNLERKTIYYNGLQQTNSGRTQRPKGRVLLLLTIYIKFKNL